MAIYLFYFLLILLFCFVIFLIIGATVAKSAYKQPYKVQNTPQASEDSIQRLASLIKIPTISHKDASLDDETQFKLFIDTVKELYPITHKKFPPLLFGNKAILFHIKGENSNKPSILMAHYDVVTVDNDKWEHDAFCAQIFDGELWGRGTLDTKITFLGVLEACEMLLGEGFVPKNDIYLAFGGDEEIGGNGAKQIIAHLQKCGVTPAFVLDEGGAVVDNVIPGMKKPMAVIGTGEKGQMNATLTIKANGGHASTPKIPSILGRLCSAVTKCEASPFKGQLTLPIKGMFKAVAPHVPFGMRIIYGNMWFFGNILINVSNKLSAEFNALFRTTLSFTMAKASNQINVVPTQAEIGVNIRSLNIDTQSSIKARMQQIIKDDDIEITFDTCSEASDYSPAEGEYWDVISNAIHTVWQDAVIAPYLMLAASDSRHYNGYCKNVYRFSALKLTTEQRKLIHGNNERIPVKDILHAVNFYTAIVKQL